MRPVHPGQRRDPTPVIAASQAEIPPATKLWPVMLAAVMDDDRMHYFNGTGWLAIFTGTETMIARTMDVDAWDEATGVALVVDPKHGTRLPVTDYSDFSHLERADQVVAAIPGGGWRAYWEDEGPGNGPLTEQVLAWLVTAMGRATPITVDAVGHVDDAESADRLIPPGED